MSDIHLANSSGERNRAVLTDANGAEWERSYSSDGPVLNRLDEGDRVTAALWRGRVTEIAVGGENQKTSGAPADMRTRILVFVLVTVPPGPLVVAVCVWRLSRRTAAGPTPGMVAALGLAFGLFFVGLFAPFLLGGRAENPWAVTVVWAVLAAVAAFVYAAYRKEEALGRAGDRTGPGAAGDHTGF